MQTLCGYFSVRSAALWPLLLLGLLPGCNRLKSTDVTPLDKAGVFLNSTAELKTLGVTDPEVQELLVARQAGASEATCLELVRIAHSRRKTFAAGRVVVSLVSAGMQEQSIVELSHMDQLDGYAGEAQAMRLARLSDTVILAVAHRRASGKVTLSGPQAAALQNAGFNEAQILADISNGMTDQAVTDLINRRNRQAASQGFVRQSGRHRRICC